MILFLGFDGVLHPLVADGFVPQAGAFSCLPRLEALLRQFPATRVVISSTWRTQFPAPALIERFSPDIRERIVGVTPDLSDQHAGWAPHMREKEIIAWLTAHDALDQPWVALDDAAWQFDRHRNRLVHCRSDVAFNAEAAATLHTLLARAL